MTEAELLSMSLHVDVNGNMHAVPHIEATTFNPGSIRDAERLLVSMRYVTNVNSITPDFRALIASAQLMFKVLYEHQQILEALVKIMDEGGQDEVSMALTEHMTANQLARRAAIEGPEILLGNSN